MRFGGALLLSILALGCRNGAPAPTTNAAASTTAPPSTAPVPPTATMPFCAYGGVGVLPADASPDDFYRVIAVVSIRATEPLSGARVRATDILGDGGVEASLRKLESVERLAADAGIATPAVGSSRGVPFDGELGVGVTNLRVEAWITKRPASRPSTLRVQVGSPASSAMATCPLEIEWPT